MLPYRSAPGPHPSPLLPSGRGDGCCGRGGTSATRGMVVARRGCCLNRGLRGFSLMGCDAPRRFVPVFWMDVPSAEAHGILALVVGVMRVGLPLCLV